MTYSDKVATRELTEDNVPLFWPMLAAARMGEQGLELYAKNLEFLSEEAKIQHLKRPAAATANRIMLDLRTMAFRDYSAPAAKGIPTIVVAPYAGHSAVIADYYKGQSLVETLLAHGLDRVLLTDWKSATVDMKDLEIDQYLAELNVCVDDLGGRVNLIGLCQGGWMSAMYAARFPGKVVSLVLAGAPIDTDAGNGPVKRMAHTYPIAFYEELVELGGGLMRGATMLRGWKNMHPGQNYIRKHIDLYEHVGDPAYLKKEETFESCTRTRSTCPAAGIFRRLSNCSAKTGLLKAVSSALAVDLTSGTSHARSTCWRVHLMTSPQRNRSSMVRNISERQRSRSRRSSFRVAISAFSWARERCSRPGHRLRTGSVASPSIQ